MTDPTARDADDAGLAARWARDVRPVGACASPQRLAEYLDRRMADDEIDGFEAHLAGCAACRAVLIDLRAAPPAAAARSWPRARRFAAQLALAAGLLLCVGTGFVLGGMTEAARGQAHQAVAQTLSFGCAALVEPRP